jgi:hypothetical protein
MTFQSGSLRALTLALFKPKAAKADVDSANNCSGVWVFNRLMNVRQPIPGVRNNASQYFKSG